MSRGRTAVAVAAALLLLGAGCGGADDGSDTSDPPSSAAVDRPPVGATWQYHLDGRPDTTVEAEVFDVDGDEATAEDVAALHDRGAYVICYLSAGSFEEWRADADDYPPDVLGNPLDGWPGERWVDIRRTDVLLPILEARMERCRDEGFDAVEPDNVAAYAADSGFPLTAEDQLAFNRAVADLAHDLGLDVALKNDPEQVAELVDEFDLAVVEECVAFGECASYRPFVDADKPVLLVEYDLPLDEVCPVAAEHGFSAILKDLDLGADLQTCPPP